MQKSEQASQRRERFSSEKLRHTQLRNSLREGNVLVGPTGESGHNLLFLVFSFVLKRKIAYLFLLSTGNLKAYLFLGNLGAFFVK